jgi:YD repeat-containing protein
VTPRESKSASAERYTVRVPTEGQVATTSVDLEVPDGVLVTEVVSGVGYTWQAARDGAGRIVRITWTREIKPRDVAEFTFTARNPAGSSLSWRAHQHFADGSTTDWVGPAGDRRPAAVVTRRP